MPVSMTQPLSQKDPYAAAGVNIDEGNALVDAIRPLVRSTARPGADAEIGGFGGLFDLKAAGFKDPILVAANDGVGTKVKIASAINKHDTIGIDLVAMCVNDLIVQGAEPLFFLDYYASGRLNVETGVALLKGIAQGCKQAGCALIGGESAEMPGVYANDDYDLAGFAVGAAERGALLPRDVQVGDVILGLASSGVHSNGYSLVRKIVTDCNLTYDAPSPFGAGTLGHALLTPTRIYVKSLLAALSKTEEIKALAHITGGGFVDNIPRILPDALCAHVDLTQIKIPPVFAWLQSAGQISQDAMLKTFNCGIGMIVIVGKNAAESVARTLSDEGESVVTLGQIGKRTDTAVSFSGALSYAAF